MKTGKEQDRNEQRFCFSGEEKIISVLRSINEDIREMIRHAENNDLYRELVKDKLKRIGIKMKHLKRVSG